MKRKDQKYYSITSSFLGPKINSPFIYEVGMVFIMAADQKNLTLALTINL